MVVLHAPDACEQHLGAVARQIAVVVMEHEHLVARRGDHAPTEHADAVHAVDLPALMEHRVPVGPTIAVRVLEDEDAVPARPAVAVPAVVLHLADPDAPQMIDVETGDVADLRLAGEERGLQAVAGVEVGDGAVRLAPRLLPGHQAGTGHGGKRDNRPDEALRADHAGILAVRATRRPLAPASRARHDPVTLSTGAPQRRDSGKNRRIQRAPAAAGPASAAGSASPRIGGGTSPAAKTAPLPRFPFWHDECMWRDQAESEPVGAIGHDRHDPALPGHDETRREP